MVETAQALHYRKVWEMKITVMGASGQIGTKVVALLAAAGHETVAASRNTGADVLTGEGLPDALSGADVLVDVVNSPNFEDGPVLDFFTRSTSNLVAAARVADVSHYVALSIVGCDALPDSGYMRAKVAQEAIITESGLPYTIVRATQFHEFADAITASLGGAFTLLKGIEVDILDDGSLDQTPAMLAKLDLVVASVHSKLKMNRVPMTKRMVAAVRNPRVNVLGHCTGRLVTGSRGTRAQSEFDARAVFEACAESNTAVEINSRPERCDPPDELIRLADELGCLFSIDSDAHAPGQLDMKAYGAQRATRLGIDPDRIVTTWDVDRVREWARPA